MENEMLKKTGTKLAYLCFDHLLGHGFDMTTGKQVGLIDMSVNESDNSQEFPFPHI